MNSIDIAKSFLFGFMTVVAFLGNGLVCAAIICERRLRKQENLFLLSLAVSDMLVAVLIMTFAAVTDVRNEWIFGTYCVVWMASDVMCCTASIFNLAAISIDRYYHIRAPLKYSQRMTRRKIIGIIGCIWGASASISFLPFLAGWALSDTHDASKCEMKIEPGYAIISSAVSFFIPCSIMLLAYTRLYLFAQRHVRILRSQLAAVSQSNVQISVNNQPQSTPASRRRAEQHVSDHKARVTVGVIMGVFIACWLPFFCVNIARSLLEDAAIPSYAFQIVTWIGYANSVANPIIYPIFSRDFRIAFQRVLMCRRTSLSGSTIVETENGERTSRLHLPKASMISSWSNLNCGEPSPIRSFLNRGKQSISSSFQRIHNTLSVSQHGSLDNALNLSQSQHLSVPIASDECEHTEDLDSSLRTLEDASMDFSQVWRQQPSTTDLSASQSFLMPR